MNRHYPEHGADGAMAFDSLDDFHDIYDMPLPRSSIDRRSKMNNQNSNMSRNTDKYSSKKATDKKIGNQSSSQNSNKKDPSDCR